MGVFRALSVAAVALLHALLLLSVVPSLLPSWRGDTAGWTASPASSSVVVDAATVTDCNGLVTAIAANDADILVAADFECPNEVAISNKNSLMRIHGDVASRTLSSAPGKRLFSVSQAANLIIEDLTIEGDRNLGSVDLFYGGMLDILYSNVAINRVVMHNCTSDIGGALFAGFSTISITDSQFYNNSATQNGGAITLVRSSGHIYGSTFHHNRALEGGALFLSNSESFDVQDSTFLLNTAGNRGGSIIVITSNVAFSRVAVTNSSVPSASIYEGGGLYAEESIIELNDVAFTNVTGSDGFYMFLVSCNTTALDTSFHFGGGVDGIVVVGANSLLRMDNVSLTRSRSVATTGVLCSRGTICVITNSRFESNVASAGSILSFDGALKSSVTDSVFKDNHIDADGIISAVYITYEFNITSCDFRNNSARNSGGAIHVTNSLSVYVDDCYFFGNTAGSGGAIHAEFRSAVSISRSYFISNLAYDAGGSISVSDNCRVNLRNVTFQYNYASNGGALALQFRSNVTMVDAVIQLNGVEFEGGAVFISGYSILDATRLSAVKNAAKYGGVVSMSTGSTLLFHDSTLTSNTGFYSGGAMYIVDFCTATIDSTSFRFNYSPYVGGALASTFARLIFKNSEFIRNRAIERGGVLSAELGLFDFDNITAFGNFAANGAFANIITGSTLTTKNSNFRDHLSAYGMILLSQRTSWVASNCVFYNNTAAYENGVFYGKEFLFVYISGSVFDQNRASINAVGALSRATNRTVIRNSTFSNNKARFYGGIFMQSMNLLLESSTFVNNSARGTGGALMLLGGGTVDFLFANASFKMDIVNSTFENNFVIPGSEAEVNIDPISNGGAIFTAEVDELNIKNSLFRGNEAYYGGGIYSSRSKVSINDTSFQNNTAKYGGGGVYWTVDTGFENSGTTVDSATEMLSFGNVADYGPLTATNIYRLAIVGYPDEVGSGDTAGPFTVETQDQYEQVVTRPEGGSEQLLVFASTVDPKSTIQGNTVIKATNGVAVFTGLVLTLYPGATVVVQFDFENINSTKPIPMRTCAPGEENRAVGSEDSGLFACSGCDSGTFPVQEKNKTAIYYICEPCPDDNANCNDGLLYVNPGYWRATNYSDNVLRCPYKDACKGGTNADDLCFDEYTGAYCSICVEGYSKQSDGSCNKCNASSKIVTPIVLASLSATIFSAICYIFVKWEKIRAYLERLVVQIAEKAEEYKLNSLRTKVKIMITFVQVLTLMPSVLVSAFPEDYLNVISGLNFIQLDFINLFDFGCLYDSNFHTRLLTATLGPFVLCGLALLVLLIKKVVLMNTFTPYRTPQMQKDFISAIIVITFLIFSPTSITIFEAFACEDFDDGKKLLIADYSIDCRSDAYLYYALYAGFMILVYPCGIPLAYYMILTYYHKFVNPSARLVVRQEERHLVDKRIIQAEKAKLRDTYAEIAHITFLYENYSPRRWYFEMLDCFRRLLLTAIPVLFLRDSVLQVVVVLIFSLVWCIVYMELRPFAKKNDNTVAIISQWAISFTLLGGIATTAADLEGDDKNAAFSVILIMMNLGIIVATIYIAARVPDVDPLQELANDIKDTNKEFEARDSDDSIGGKDGIADSAEFAPDSDDEADEGDETSPPAAGTKKTNDTKNPMQPGSKAGLPVADAKVVGPARAGAPEVKKANNNYAGSHLFGSINEPLFVGANRNNNKGHSHSTDSNL